MILWLIAALALAAVGAFLAAKETKLSFWWLLPANAAVWIVCLLTHRTVPVTAFLLSAGEDLIFCAAVHDARTKRIPNLFLILLAVLAAAMLLIDTEVPWTLRVIGSGIGYLPLFLLRLCGEKLTKHEVIGEGDALLSAILGLLLGLQNYLFCAVVACLVALVAIRVLRFRKKYDKTRTYAFSPFFFVGYTVAALFGSLLFSSFYTLFY